MSKQIDFFEKIFKGLYKHSKGIVGTLAFIFAVFIVSIGVVTLDQTYMQGAFSKAFRWTPRYQAGRYKFTPTGQEGQQTPIPIKIPQGGAIGIGAGIAGQLGVGGQGGQEFSCDNPTTILNDTSRHMTDGTYYDGWVYWIERLTGPSSIDYAVNRRRSDGSGNVEQLFSSRGANASLRYEAELYTLELTVGNGGIMIQNEQGGYIHIGHDGRIRHRGDGRAFMLDQGLISRIEVESDGETYNVRVDGFDIFTAPIPSFRIGRKGRDHLIKLLASANWGEHYIIDKDTSNRTYSILKITDPLRGPIPIVENQSLEGNEYLELTGKIPAWYYPEYTDRGVERITQYTTSGYIVYFERNRFILYQTSNGAKRELTRDNLNSLILGRSELNRDPHYDVADRRSSGGTFFFVAEQNPNGEWHDIVRIKMERNTSDIFYNTFDSNSRPIINVNASDGYVTWIEAAASSREPGTRGMNLKVCPID